MYPYLYCILVHFFVLWISTVVLSFHSVLHIQCSWRSCTVLVWSQVYGCLTVIILYTLISYNNNYYYFYIYLTLWLSCLCQMWTCDSTCNCLLIYSLFPGVRHTLVELLSLHYRADKETPCQMNSSNFTREGLIYILPLGDGVSSRGRSNVSLSSGWLLGLLPTYEAYD